MVGREFGLQLYGRLGEENPSVRADDSSVRNGLHDESKGLGGFVGAAELASRAIPSLLVYRV